jgi:hypothetical protein
LPCNVEEKTNLRTKKGGHMKLLYSKRTTIFITAMTLATATFGQSKVKTITIINGDTTITESNDDTEFKKIEKEISVIREGNSKEEKKTVVKKIIINSDNDKNGDAIAYAYSTDGDDAEVITSDDGKETRIVIKNDKNDGKAGEKKKVVKRAIEPERAESREKMNLNISIKDKTATLGIETSSKEPLYISVLDEAGKQVFYDSKKDAGKYNKDVKLEKGTYFLNIIQNKKTSNEKIIIE